MKKTMIPTKDRPTTMISIRMPVDVVEKLKEIAPAKGMSGYQALIKYYVGKGLREDLDLFLQVRSHAETLDILGKIFQDMTPEQLDELRKRAEEIKHPLDLKNSTTDTLSPVSEKEQEQSTA